MQRTSRAHEILIVEDNENEVLLLQRAFARAGIEATLHIARDGAEAISMLDSADRKPSVMLLDLKLPKRSGFEVLEWLRAKEMFFPVVIFSTSSEKSDIERAYGLGANAYLVKPTSFDTLVEIIRTTGDFWLDLNHLPALT
jgi:DNA-binding response OmpR family regulator